MNRPGSGEVLQVLFFGTPEFAAIGLTKILDTPNIRVGAVITQPDRPAGRGGRLQSSAVKILAAAHQIPVLQPERIRSSEEVFLKELEPHGPFDAGIVIAFGQILPQKVLDFPRAGCINVHASVLPRWRGAAPMQRALLSGDLNTGISLMKMEAGLDTGPVFCVADTPIREDDSLGSLHNRLANLGAELLCRKLMGICAGEIPPIPQVHALATYARRIANEEAEIDWSRAAPEIARQVRALNPEPGARTHLRGSTFKILKAQPIKEERQDLPPGTAVAAGTSIQIRCGSGSLALQEVQLAGKKRLPIGEFLRGCSLQTGEILGGGDVN